jgi:hypothetical protein
VKQVVNRTLLAIVLALLAFWAMAMLFGALNNAIKDTGPTFSSCRSCAPHWR